MNKTEDIKRRVSEIVSETLVVDPVDEQVDLFEEGLLDSLGLINLMMALEDEFGINIPAEELRIEDYQSIHSMSEMINRISVPLAFSKHG